MTVFIAELVINPQGPEILDRLARQDCSDIRECDR